MPTPPIHSTTSPTDIAATCTTYGLKNLEFTSLQTLSTAAKATAYCPYSLFRVGATILTSTGEYISGANVENAAYPVGTCAERVAFGKAITEIKERDNKAGEARGEGKGEKGWGFKALAVATDVVGTPASPCGMCRQFIREFCDLDLPILMFNKDDSYIVMRLEELLPLSFGPEALPKPGHD